MRGGQTGIYGDISELDVERPRPDGPLADPGLRVLPEPDQPGIEVGDQMQEELLAIWRRTGMTAVFVTHSVEEAVYLATKVVLMTPAPGRIADVVDVGLPNLAELPGRQVRTHPEFVAMRETVDEHFFGAGLTA